MYNDSLETNSGNAMAGLAVGDNRAAAGGAAGWGHPGSIERKRWEEKYVPPAIAGSNPTAWVENKSGVGADVMDTLLRQSEKGEKQATAGEWKDGMPDPNNPEFANRVPRSPFVKTRPSPLSQRLTTTDRVSSRHRSRVDADTSPVVGVDMDEPFIAYMPSPNPNSAYYSRTAGQASPSGASAYVLNGTQRGYELDPENKEGYWSMPGHFSNKDSRAPKPDTAGVVGVAGGLGGAPKAGVQAAQMLAFYEEGRERRVLELHSKLGIDKVRLHTRVDTTPQAGHNTAM